MVEEDTTGNESSPFMTCIKPEWDENGKLHWPGIQNQKKSENAKAVLLQPPVKAIPVIFLPGVMGTNLMTNKASQTEDIWRGDSLGGVFLKWAGVDGERRRRLLDPDSTKVDILSVLDNMQRILNCRAGTLAHLPDYGLPDMTKILQGMPGTAHEMMGTLSAVLLKYEPRLKKIAVVMLEQKVPGELRYAIDAELKGIGLVRYGTEFMPEGRVLLRHLKQQQYLDTLTRL